MKKLFTILLVALALPLAAQKMLNLLNPSLRKRGCKRHFRHSNNSRCFINIVNHCCHFPARQCLL